MSDVVDFEKKARELAAVELEKCLATFREGLYPDEIELAEEVIRSLQGQAMSDWKRLERRLARHEVDRVESLAQELTKATYEAGGELYDVGADDAPYRRQEQANSFRKALSLHAEIGAVLEAAQRAGPEVKRINVDGEPD